MTFCKSILSTGTGIVIVLTALSCHAEEIVQRVTPQGPIEIDIRQQLDSAVQYWYGQIRDKMANETEKRASPALPKLHKEGEWMAWEFVHHHGRATRRVLSRFLDAEETRLLGYGMFLDDVKVSLRSSIESEAARGIKTIETLTTHRCESKDGCIQWLEENEEFLVWNNETGVFKIDKERKGGNWAPSVRGLRLSLTADKAAYAQNEPIVLTAKLENILPASAEACSVFPVNARMLIHSEIDFDVRNEEGELAHFVMEKPPALAVKDFKMLDGGQSIETQEELTSRLYQNPLAPGHYRIRATYQNYELGKALGLPPSCAGDSVLLEGGPAWTGRIFSNGITIEVK